jgi:hypothetical protein
MQQRYRQDYPGEFIITRTTFRDGRKIQEREWIDNPIVNQHISGRAAVIATADDRERFDHARLQYHRGGLRGSRRLQTYATGEAWQHMRLDFYVTTDVPTLEAIRGTDYGDNTTVYTNLSNVLLFPGDFFLVPHSPRLHQIALPLYLAAFDGHREIFVLGLDRETKISDPQWIRDVDTVMSVYDSTTFYLVGVESNMPDSWRQHPNVRCQQFREWISYCDI